MTELYGFGKIGISSYMFWDSIEEAVMLWDHLTLFSSSQFEGDCRKGIFCSCHAFPAVEQNSFVLQVSSQEWVDQANLCISKELAELAQDYSKHTPREFFKGENVSVLIEYSFKSHDGVNTHKSERWYQAN